MGAFSHPAYRLWVVWPPSLPDTSSHSTVLPPAPQGQPLQPPFRLPSIPDSGPLPLPGRLFPVLSPLSYLGILQVLREASTDALMGTSSLYILAASPFQRSG